MKTTEFTYNTVKALIKPEFINTAAFQNKPSQVYPLEIIQPYLNIPLALSKSNYNLLLLLEDGSLNLQINTEKYHVEKNSLIFISIGTIYAFREIGEQAKGYLMLIESKTITAILSNKTILHLSLIHPITRLSGNTSLWFDNICKLIYDELNRTTSNRNIGQSLVRALIYKLLETANIQQNLPREQEIALQFNFLINEHYLEQHSTGFYAEKLSISPNYLNRCVQAVFKKSARNFIIESRILHAQLMMLDSTKDIAEIAYDLNFEDPSYFSRIFKKITGRTPSEYKAQNMHA
ncbi:MAG: AraC family transcriptional regulator [Chitinophagaceae bacterium]|nr:AraC family transcriptional regulator [Chitinophagaceae bacterium]